MSSFFLKLKITLFIKSDFVLSGSRDSNPESLVPKTSMLAVTPHPDDVHG